MPAGGAHRSAMRLQPLPSVVGGRGARLTLALLVALTLCGAPAQAVAPPPPGGVFPVVEDAAGRRVTVKAPFTRIISLYGAHTENLLALGADAAVIGVNAREDHLPATHDRPVFSYHDDPERFLAARPDLVLIRPMIDRGYAPLVHRLEAGGITVVSLQPVTGDQVYRYWADLGRLAGREAAAARLVARFTATVRRFEAATHAIRPRQRVYFEAIHRRMKTFAPGAVAIFVLETAGGVNLAADARPVRNTNIAAYGKERILRLASRIDVYVAQYGRMNRPTVTLIREEPGFQIIKAVRENRIHIIDEKIVSRPSPRLLHGILELTAVLCGERLGAERLAQLTAAIGWVDALWAR